MNLPNNIVTLLDNTINKNENKNEEFITQTALKNKVMSNKFALVIGMIIAIAYLISYIYGVYLSFFCSKNIICRRSRAIHHLGVLLQKQNYISSLILFLLVYLF